MLSRNAWTFFSSRTVERATYKDVAFRVLASGEHPHFTTVNAFRLSVRPSSQTYFLSACEPDAASRIGDSQILFQN